MSAVVTSEIDLRWLSINCLPSLGGNRHAAASHRGIGGSNAIATEGIRLNGVVRWCRHDNYKDQNQAV